MMFRSPYAAALPLVADNISLGHAFEVARANTAVGVITGANGFHFYQTDEMIAAVAGAADVASAINRMRLSDVPAIAMGRVDPRALGFADEDFAEFDEARISGLFVGHSAPLLVASTFNVGDQPMALTLGNPVAIMRLVPRVWRCPRGGEPNAGPGWCDAHNVAYVPGR